MLDPDTPAAAAAPASGGLLRVGPADLGERVSLRRRLASGGFSDTVGVLLAWDVEGNVRVRRRTGEVVTVPAAALVAGRVVPAPARHGPPPAQAER